MQIGLYAGSFDPFTNGHLHVVKQASKFFDKVIIGIGVHPTKKRRFDKDIMKSAIEKALAHNGITNATVICYSNLTIEIAEENNVTFLVRGIRNGMDYQYEENIASVNEEISGIDTVYFRAGQLGNISSSMVMELMQNNRDVSKYVPNDVLDAITNK